MSENKSLSNTNSKGWSRLEILLKVLFSAFSLICIWFLWPDVVWPLLKIIDAKDWNETSCVVISSQPKIKTQSGLITTTFSLYSVDIVYSYEIKGKKYQSNRYDFFNEATAIIDRYPPGTRTPCYVNPKDPTDAVIRHQDFAGGLYQVLELHPFGWAILFISFIFLLFCAGSLSSLWPPIVRFIEHRNLTETRLIYWVVKIVNFIKGSIRIIVSFVGLISLLAVVTICICFFITPPLVLFEEYAYIAVLIWILIPVLIVVGIGYLSHLFEEAKGSSWRTLAASRRLTFVPAKFLRHKSYITGTYRHHHLKLEAFKKGRGKYSYTCTRLLVSVDNLAQDSPQNESHLPGGQVASKDVMSLLTPTSPNYILKGAKLKGSITAQAVDQNVYLCYEQDSIENDSEYLGYLFDLLSDLAEAYPAVVASGGEAVPFLKDKIANHHHASIATELLRAIARNTTARIGDRASQLLCPSCLARYKAHKVLLESLEYLTYYGCRICGQSRKFLEGRVVAVLDSQMDTERVQQDGTWRVNWLTRRALFDFDEVEIVQAPDEDVERFVVQVGNDTDDFRRSRYRAMSCKIAPDCRLSENTLRILTSTFGSVSNEVFHANEGIKFG